MPKRSVRKTGPLHRQVWTPLIASLVLIGACGEGPSAPSAVASAPDSITALPRALTSSEALVLERSNRFAFGLLREVARAHEPGDNVFLSPLSASMALGMTMNGAAGETHGEMRDMLGFEGMTRGEINAAYRGLIDLLVGLDPSVETRLANSIWYRTGFPIASDFVETVRESFDATVSGLDFAAPDAAATINAWVEEQTNGRIDGIVDDPIHPAAMMFLLNAVYFNASWTQAFDAEETRPRDFTRADGTVARVPTMIREADSGPLLTATAQGWRALEMPYGGQAFAMTILMPADPSQSLDDLLPDLDAAVWHDLVSRLWQTGAGVEMPRFRIEYEAGLNDALDALGMRQAFVADADFSPMTGTPNDLYVHMVKQKTWVDVHEEGTEAAAVTSVEVRATSAGPIPLIRIDRPFVVAIRERLTGTILFLGTIGDPAAS
jgi:serine protease inhibitor